MVFSYHEGSHQVYQSNTPQRFSFKSQLSKATSLFLPSLALLLKKTFGTRSDLRNLYAYKVIEGSLCNIRDSGQKQISTKISSETCSSQTTQLQLTHREIPIVHDGKILPSMRRLGAYHQPKEDALCCAGCGPPPIIIIRENYHL